MKELTCIICPRGCSLHIDENNLVTGNACPRGITYAINEMKDPKRTLTSTVRIKGESIRRLPIVSQGQISKDKIFEVMEELNKIIVNPPIKCGDIVAYNICDTGVNIKATRSVLK